MASFFRRKSAGKKQQSDQSSFWSSFLGSPRTSSSPILSETTEHNTSRRSIRSLLDSSYEEYSRNESFDVLPKTDYTYARSGSYSPRHLRKSYVNPNMSRRRLRGVVTPPVSMLEYDSDSDNADVVDLRDSAPVEIHSTRTENHTFSSATAATPATYNQASHADVYETDQLEFDDSEEDMEVNGGDVRTPSRGQQKRHMDMENLHIQQAGRSKEEYSAYRHYYEGMVLRSGSRLKGVKRYLDSHDPSRRKSTSIITTDISQSADKTDNALDARGTMSATGMYKRGRGGGYDDNYGTTTTTTTVTKTVTEFEEELNQNNSARARRSSRSPKPSKSSRRYRQVDQDEIDRERKQFSEDYHRDKNHQVRHMYGLDQTDDFSDADTDSYTHTSSSWESSGSGGSTFAAKGPKGPKGQKGPRHHHHRHEQVCPRPNFFVSMITTVMCAFSRVFEPLTSALWRVATPSPGHSAGHSSQTSGSGFGNSLWMTITTVSRYFILWDAWLLGRRSRRGCCVCLPLLILLPILLYAGGHYLRQAQVGSRPVSSYFAMPSLFASQKTTNMYTGDSVQNVNMHQEVRMILQQLLSERRDWLTKTEIEQLVKGMLGPEMESLRISLLNIANEGNAEQSALKVDQNDGKVRLMTLEGQMASIQTRAKNLEDALAEARKQLSGSLSGSREKQTQDMAMLERTLLTMRSQLDTLQNSYAGLHTANKKCCFEETAFQNVIRDQVNGILAEMFEDNSGGGAFAGWLNQNFVDKGEFERQLNMLTMDITSRINSGMGHGSAKSSFFLPTAAGTLGEDAVKLLVEDALLKFSADRTGLPDYALESSGGSVISTRCSETYYKKTALISIFGIPLWYTSNSPRTVIQPEVHPGQCWAFKGDSGYIVIQLSVPIRPTGFSLEHIPKSLSPTGSIDSAPKDFAVFGLRTENDKEGVNLGNYSYVTVGKPIQHFDVQIRNPGVFAYVELRVLNNHGNKDYTCLYRFRAHGVPQ